MSNVPMPTCRTHTDSSLASWTASETRPATYGVDGWCVAPATHVVVEGNQSPVVVCVTHAKTWITRVDNATIVGQVIPYLIEEEGL